MMHSGYLKIIAAGYAIMKFVRIGADFESKMAEISTIALRGVASVAEQRHIMEQLSETARKLGAETSFTATQAAEGILELTKAGYDYEKSQKAVNAVLQVAKASALDLGTASTMMADTLNMWGLSADKAEYAMDVLYNTASSVTTNITDLFGVMEKVGPLAKGAGMSFEETAAAAGALAEGAQKASIAGTGLRGIMGRLLKPTQEVEDALDDMGLKAKDVNPQVLGWAGAFEVLEAHGMDAAKAIRIFGQEAVASAVILQDRVDLMRDLTEANESALGSTRRAAERRAQTFWGRFQEFGSAVQDIILEMWDVAGPGLTRFVQGLTTGAREIKKAMEPILDAGKQDQNMGLGLLTIWEDFKRGADTAMSHLEMAFDKTIAIIGAGLDALGQQLIDAVTGPPGQKQQGAIDRAIQDALAKNPSNKGLQRVIAERARDASESEGTKTGLDRMKEEADRRHRERIIAIDAEYARNLLEIADQRDRYKKDEAFTGGGGKATGGGGSGQPPADLDALMGVGSDSEGRLDSLVATQATLLDQIKEEQTLVGLTNDEREKEILLRDAAREAMTSGIADIPKYLQAVEKEIDKLQSLRKIADLAYDIGNAFGDATIDIIENINDIEDAAERMLRSLQRIILEHLVARPIAEGVGKLLFSIGSKLATIGVGAAGAGAGTTDPDVDPGGEMAIRRGAVFDNGVIKGMSSGRLFNVPHYFRSGSDRGVIGEGGIEAAMPLARTSDGRLGVLMAGDGGGGGVTVVQNITTPDADSFRRSQRQIWRKAMSHAGKARM